MDVDQQFEQAMRAVTMADVDLATKILTDPAAVTIDEQRTVAEKLGLKRGLLSFAVNTVSDPVVWIALLMSKRFPMLNWLKGTVPQRFVGTANEFTGISHFVRPVEQYFRGTPVPRLVALQQYREAKVRDIGAKMFETMARPKWKEEMPIVSMIMEGQHPRGATPELTRVAGQLRNNMDEIWRLMSRTKRIRGGFEGEAITPARAGEWAPSEVPKYLRDYLPHIPLLGDASTIEVSPLVARRRLGMGKTAQVLQAARENPEHVWTIGEANRLESNFSRYQLFLNKTQGQVYNQNLFRRQRFHVPLQSLQGEELWISNLNVILQKYVHSAARTYALNAPLTAQERALATVVRPDGPPIVPSDEPIVVQVINYGLGASGARMVQRPIAGTNKMDLQMVPGSENPLMIRALQNLVRNMRGKSDEGEILIGNLFSAIGRKFDQAAINAGYKQKAQVDFALRAMQRDRQWRSINNGAVSFFYASTLGMNPWSAIQNVLQPVLTTAPALGIGPTLRGTREMLSRVPRYSREVMNQWSRLKTPTAAMRVTRPEQWFHRMNEAAQRAFNATFPELAQAGLKLDPRLFDINPNATASFGPRGTRAFKSYDDFARWMLQPFTHAELANQATTFFAARHKLRNALRTGEYEVPLGVGRKPLTGKNLDEWLNFEASGIVNATQFRPGPGGRSSFQSQLPAPFRMFTSFPTRALSFMVESTVRGAMTGKQLESAGLLEKVTGGRNWGTVARMLLYGRILSHGAKEALGLDIGRAVGLTAPFTFTPQGQYLAPLPVPPIAGAVIGAVSAAANRDIKEMKPLYLPGVGQIPIPKTLFPGGVGITRAVKAVQHWRPDLGGFVDDDERLMYRGNTSDLVLTMIGIPTEKSRRTRNYMERISDVRWRVRQFRRKYARAWSNYDLDSMRTLEGQWREKFPDWPPLTVTARDAKRYQQNARIPMIQRMLNTMGSTGRYLEAEILEVDPELLGAPEPASVLGGF